MCYVRFKINNVDFETSLTVLGFAIIREANIIINFELHTTQMIKKQITDVQEAQNVAMVDTLQVGYYYGKYNLFENY